LLYDGASQLRGSREGDLQNCKDIKYVWRPQLSEAMAAWARSVLCRAACRFDMLVLDHGVFRLAYLNQHRLGEPCLALRTTRPPQYRWLCTARPAHDRQPSWSAHLLERLSCERTGITLIDFKLRSLRSGHSRFGRSGVLDLFFDHYVEVNRKRPMAFLDWVDKATSQRN